MNVRLSEALYKILNRNKEISRDVIQLGLLIYWDKLGDSCYIVNLDGQDLQET